MKKEIFYLIGALVGALLVLLAVPLGDNYAWAYLSANGGGMDTQSFVLLMQSAVTGFQILGGVLFVAEIQAIRSGGVKIHIVLMIRSNWTDKRQLQRKRRQKWKQKF